jgi:3-methyl-2-oxobutanoate hydroxymethyltransferase
MYSGDAPAPSREPITVPGLRRMKSSGTPIVALTAYDAGFAAALDAGGVDVVLVGDSLGMVVQGHSSTLPVRVEDISYHTACVARGLRTALLVSDLPFQSDSGPQQALAASTAFLQAGAAMVKLEGAGFKLEVIRYLVEREVPVCAHLGLTPQSVLRLGGYRVQGKEDSAAQKLLEDARAVEAAGATLLVLECVPAGLAKRITAELSIPTIGIGAGADCDGQILVLHDLLGLGEGRRPRFVKDFLASGGSIRGAVEAYAAEVRERRFPGPGHIY